MATEATAAERRMMMSIDYPCVHWDKGKCEKFSDDRVTNADKIRSMTDEELAVWLVEKTEYQESVFTYPSYLNFLTESDDTKEGAIKGTLEWLQQPAEDIDDGT